jgi:CRISPR/Cas system CMR subunit Cmr4 (Cas7 group RAMP superfamily)
MPLSPIPCVPPWITCSYHIERIKQEIRTLNSKLMNLRSRTEANEAENENRSLKLALAHYELALQIENEVFQGKRSAKAGQGDAAD